MEKKAKMANQSYYKINGHPSDNNLSDVTVDLTVNCCGECVLREPWGHARPTSRHDFYLIYSMGGDIVGSIDGRPVRIGASHAVCISAETKYQFGSPSPMEEWTRYYWIHFTGSEAESLLRRSGLLPNTVYELGQCEELFGCYERLFSEFRTVSPEFEYNAALQLRYILYTVGRASRTVEAGRLDRSIRYIHTHLRYELSVEELAGMEFLGTSRYRELFRSITGTSPIEYVTRLRIERAKYLLSQTDMTVSEVAEAVGYDTRHYFQSLFKRRVGKTPGQWRAGLHDG